MTIKELFDKAEGGTLDYSTFEKLMKEGNAKFVDLSEGGYVDKNKFDNEVSTRDAQISTLSETIQTRDKDLKDLKAQFKDTSTSDAEKLKKLEDDLSSLQNQYKTETENYKTQLSKQAYEFAVKEFANSKKFTSTAAKRDFERSLIAEELKMDGNKILGAEDFLTKYSADNSDAFVVESAPTKQETAPTAPAPSFVAPTAPPSQTKKQSLTEMMRAKNENPDAVITF